MKLRKPFWNVDKIRDRCKELGIEFLDNSYKHNIKGNFRCRCGNKFNRLFSNVNKGQILCKDCERERDKVNKEKLLKQNFFKFKDYVENQSNPNCTVLSDYRDYKSNKSKIKIRCSCGNIFHPTANNFMKGHHRCLKCSREDIGKMKRISKYEIFEFVKNNGYTPLEYKYTNEHRLIVKCGLENHKPYEVSYRNFYSGHRCPQCNESKGERKVFNFLNKNNFDFETQYKFNDLIGENNQGLRFDFCVKTKNNDIVLIEYDGIQHFEPKFGEKEFLRTLKNDKRKNEYCKDKDIKLLRISYKEFDNIDEILANYLIHGNTEIT